MPDVVNIMWFRRDLRLDDNAALYHALKSGSPVVPIFIFDRNILDKLENKSDRRVTFIRAALAQMQEKLADAGTSLEAYYGKPEEVFKKLLHQYKVEKVFTNHDYEPYAVERDKSIELLLKQNATGFRSYKDHVVFEKSEVVKDDGKPYSVFTPYSRRWKSVLNEFYLKEYPVKKYFHNFYKQSIKEIPSFSEMGFKEMDKPFPKQQLDKEIISHYKEQRDFPGINGTSKLGVHLRFGTISIRTLAKKSLALSETYLNELIWRDFYQMILWHYPQIGKGRAFKPEYENIQWRNNEREFERWYSGATGYPIVDAGMRELNETGFMHNRVRMIVASFYPNIY